MRTEKFTFTSQDGHSLNGRLELPAGLHRATALFSHCFTCGKDIAAARRITQRLTLAGFAVLRFDFTGLGHSGGEFANTTFSSNVDDILAAADALAENKMPPSLIIGHSLGGSAVLAAAGRIDSVKAVVTIGAPDDPKHVLHHFDNSIDEIVAKGSAEVDLGGRPFVVGKGFIDDIRATELLHSIATLRKALLVLHAPLDQVVSIDSAAKVFLAAKHPKSFVTLDGADHLLSSSEDAQYAADVIAGWVGRYIDLGDIEATKSAPEGVVRVCEAEPDGFLQEVYGGPRHQTLADEPKAVGGSDLGMTPYGFMSAGLGACTSMTIRMYARRKNWPLTGISVDVTHDKKHVKDIEKVGGKIDHFHRTIHLEGPLDEGQRERLLEIADKCPVHRTLESKSHIKTVLADPE